jgi:hypothetical protein
MTQRKSRESRRRPVVQFASAELVPGVLALIRLTWFREGRQWQVEEFAVAESEGGCTVVLAVIEQAEEQGYDLTVLSEHDFCDCYET